MTNVTDLKWIEGAHKRAEIRRMDFFRTSELAATYVDPGPLRAGKEMYVRGLVDGPEVSAQAM